MSPDEVATLLDALADRLSARLMPDGTHVAKTGSDVAAVLVDELRKAAEEVSRL